MIDTKTEELAALYVLDLLQGAELAEFERRLADEADVANLVNELSAGLHAPMKHSNGPERMDLLQGIQERIGSGPQKSTTLNETASDTKRISIGAPSRWLRGLSVAAAILLVLNIFQFVGPDNNLSELQTELAESRRNEQALIDENETIKAFNKSWETEYTNLAQRMLPFVKSQDGLGQFTVIELMSARGNQTMGSTADVSQYFLSRSPLKFTSAKLPGIPEQENTTAATVGYAVWKQDENRGYIDLYNLAEARPGREAFLWLKESKADKYLPVGFLPAIHRGTGSFYFTVDEEKFELSQVLITEESVDGPGERPSSYHLMEGP